jgi:2-oxoglutarate ferredoxin oxidoreductase subunit delta
MEIARIKYAKEGLMPKGTVAITAERCKGCGFCVEFCPTHVLELSSAFNPKGYHPPHMVAPEKCSGCNLCGMYCPDFAIFGFRLGANGEAKGAKK